MLSIVRGYIDEHIPLPPGTTIVVGVSGGVDSVVLLDVLQQQDYRLVAAHVNYRLRGDASDDDERWVRDMCRAQGIPCEVHRVDDHFWERAAGRSMQEAARLERYTFFAGVAAAREAGYVAVGHHRDDQAETVLLHLLRGSGIEGLAGMAPDRPLEPDSPVRLVRPLLGVDRAAILAYAGDRGLSWREDASNAGASYRRNAVRHRVVAAIRDAFGAGAVRNVARTAGILRGYVDATVAPELARRFGEVAREAEGGGTLDVEALRRQPGVWQGRLVLEALRCWIPDAPVSATLVGEVLALSGRQVGRRLVLPGGTVWRERSTLFFTPGRVSVEASPDESPPRVLLPGHDLTFDDGRLRASFDAYRPGMLLDAGADVCLLDADRIDEPLIVRRWRSGDRMQPLGMEGHKKVSDILTDRKIPSRRRGRVRVIESGGEILWVIGLRQAEFGKIQAGTQRMLRLEWMPG